MLTYKYIHVQFHAKEKKEKKNTAESKNGKKKLQKSKLFLALTKQTVFKGYKVSSSHFNSLRKDLKFWHVPLACC